MKMQVIDETLQQYVTLTDGIPSPGGTLACMMNIDKGTIGNIDANSGLNSLLSNRA